MGGAIVSRPRVYASDNQRLQAWRERKRQEQSEYSQRQEHKEQRPSKELAQEGESASPEQLAQAMQRLEFIAESMVMKGYCSPAEATDIQVLVRVAVREPALFEKWRQERDQTPLRGLVPWRDE
jgi:hypothetical protein